MIEGMFVFMVGMAVGGACAWYALTRNNNEPIDTNPIKIESYMQQGGRYFTNKPSISEGDSDEK